MRGYAGVDLLVIDEAARVPDELYRSVRPMLAVSNGRLKLIDGHLRRDIDSEMEVDVKVLDLNDDEARTLLSSLDPLAALAETQFALHERWRELTPASSPKLDVLWRETAEKCLKSAAG